jgi:hypothetical protein
VNVLTGLGIACIGFVAAGDVPGDGVGLGIVNCFGGDDEGADLGVGVTSKSNVRSSNESNALAKSSTAAMVLAGIAGVEGIWTGGVALVFADFGVLVSYKKIIQLENNNFLPELLRQSPRNRQTRKYPHQS